MRVALLGVGLIGGSLARALKRSGWTTSIVGYARREDELQKAIELGVIDRYSLEPECAVEGADVVVLCTPLKAMESLLTQIKPALTDQTIITDVGSAKGVVVEAARAALGELPSGFVPAHPIAGTEKSGVSASFAELYDDRKVIITPVSESADWAVNAVRAMWEATGAKVESMSVDKHDDVLAATSHLPHLLAFTLVDLLAHNSEHEKIFHYAAGGFRDFTRIASSDPVMWRDISVTNKAAILNNIEQYQTHLATLKALIEEQNEDEILNFYQRAKNARDAHIE